MQTLEAVSHITRSCRAIIGAQPYAIGPLSIAMRQNPYGSRVMSNPQSERVAMTGDDPRQRGLFGAAWLAGYAAALDGARLERLTLGDEDIKAFRDRFNIPIPDSQIADIPFYKPADDTPEMKYLHERRKALGGYLPHRRVKADESFTVPSLETFKAVLEPTAQAESEYVNEVRSLARLGTRFYTECTPGYYNSEGAVGNKGGFFSDMYGAGPLRFFEVLDAWRANGRLEGLDLR